MGFTLKEDNNFTGLDSEGILQLTLGDRDKRNKKNKARKKDTNKNKAPVIHNKKYIGSYLIKRILLLST